MSYTQLKLKNQLCHRLYKASNGIVRAYREHLEALDLTYPQYVVLMALWETDRVPIAALIHTTSIDGGALTQILKKLSQKSLVVVERAESDGRQRLVNLSGEGKLMQEKVKDIPQAMLCKIPDITESELGSLIFLLDKLNRALDR